MNTKTTAPITGAQVRDFFVAAGEALKPFVGQDTAHFSCTFNFYGNGAVKSEPLFAVQIAGQPIVTHKDFDTAKATALAAFKPDDIRAKAAKMRADADALETHLKAIETAAPAPGA